MKYPISSKLLAEQKINYFLGVGMLFRKTFYIHLEKTSSVQCLLNFLHKMIINFNVILKIKKHLKEFNRC